jgi:site-specific DNA-methyltransferase (cytosine-N4-specific)
VSQQRVGVDVRTPPALSGREGELLALARLDSLAPVEAWRVTGTNRQLAYSTHGVFRFFGKFPPPVARQLVESLSNEGDWVLDPMAGSGTTAVEALALRRNVVARDVSPLSLLLCRVKTTHVSEAESHKAFRRVRRRFTNGCLHELPEPVGLRNATHWFLPETLESLGRIRAAIHPGDEPHVRDLLLTAFASTVRRVSKATTQQGRLFLDAAKAEPDAWPTFAARFERYAAAIASLPRERKGTKLVIEQLDVRAAPSSQRRFRLAIAHPPYFNNYKYSSINALELAWLGIAAKEVRHEEIRESFKVGRPEKLRDYLEDLAAAVVAIESQLEDEGVLALMMGDTIIRGTYIDVTRQLLRTIASGGSRLRLDRIVLRVPRYTEASWVASQRRTGDKVGVALNDFILVLSKTRPR